MCNTKKNKVEISGRYIRIELDRKWAFQFFVKKKKKTNVYIWDGQLYCFRTTGSDYTAARLEFGVDCLDP